jgi:hypothetical protein
MEASKSLDKVRACARSQRQHAVRLSKPESQDGLGRTSLQKIRTLKSLENEVDTEMTDEELLEEVSVVGRVWDWFQRSIGNR